MCTATCNLNNWRNSKSKRYTYMAEILQVSNIWIVFNFFQVLNCCQVVWCKILVLLKDISSKSKLSGQVHITWYIISGGRILRNSAERSTLVSRYYKIKAVSIQKAWREAWWSEKDSEERVTCMASISCGCAVLNKEIWKRQMLQLLSPSP
jgi:hypothetical protein